MAKNTLIEWPNREKASSKLMRVVVIVALLVSSAMIGIVSIMGWDLMQQAKVAQIVFIVINLIFVIQLVRWSRGVLPMAAGLAALIAIFGGVSISSWYERDAPGYLDASLSAQIGFLTIVIVAIQFAVIVLTIIAFTQNWQTEVERHHSEIGDPPPRTGGSRPGRSVPA